MCIRCDCEMVLDLDDTDDMPVCEDCYDVCKDEKMRMKYHCWRYGGCPECGAELEMRDDNEGQPSCAECNFGVVDTVLRCSCGGQWVVAIGDEDYEKINALDLKDAVKLLQGPNNPPFCAECGSESAPKGAVVVDIV